jgi:hypothetical protein
MDTNSDQDTSIQHLFNEPEPAPAYEPANSEPNGHQPPPPEPNDPYSTVEEPAQQAPVANGQQQAEPPQQSHQVPLAELVETRRRAQAAEEAHRESMRRIEQLEDTMRRLSQPQQPQAPQIDPYVDPEAFVGHITGLIEQKFHHQALTASEQNARKQHGDALVEEAAHAAHRQGLDGYFAARPSPHEEVIAWYKSQKIASEIGTDPDAYRQKIEAEARARVLAELKQGTPPPSNLTPPLSSATRANAAPGHVESDKDFFNSMMNRRG